MGTPPREEQAYPATRRTRTDGRNSSLSGCAGITAKKLGVDTRVVRFHNIRAARYVGGWTRKGTRGDVQKGCDRRSDR